MQELYKGKKAVSASSEKTWRNWLQKNHEIEEAIWLIIYKKESNVKSVYYSEAVDQALCFGWVDSLPNKRDENSYYVYFSKRKLKSNWSKVNKEKVLRLTEQNLITPAGQKMIDYAKSSGTWDALNDVENLIEPKELKAALKKDKNALINWEKAPRSFKRGQLELILNAKTKETKDRRIEKLILQLNDKK